MVFVSAAKIGKLAQTARTLFLFAEHLQQCKELKLLVFLEVGCERWRQHSVLQNGGECAVQRLRILGVQIQDCHKSKVLKVG